jgi:hypothetical protein
MLELDRMNRVAGSRSSDLVRPGLGIAMQEVCKLLVFSKLGGKRFSADAFRARSLSSDRNQLGSFRAMDSGIAIRIVR